MTIPFPGLDQPQGWVCPKCGRVYAPWVYTCAKCDPSTVTFPATGTPFPPVSPTSGGTHA